MFFNRLRSAVPAQPIVNPSPSPEAFLLCPLMGTPFATAAQWQQGLYAWAMAQAQAVVRPSLPERDLLGVWN